LYNLKEMGLVEEKRHGTIRMFTPKFDTLAVVFKKGFGVNLLIDKFAFK